MEALAGLCDELAGRLHQTAAGLRKQQTPAASLPPNKN